MWSYAELIHNAPGLYSGNVLNCATVLVFDFLFSTPFAVYSVVLYLSFNHSDISPVLFYSQNADITNYLKYSHSLGLSIFVLNSVLWAQTCVLWMAPTQALCTYLSRSLPTYLYMYLCMYSPCVNRNMSNKQFWSCSWSCDLTVLGWGLLSQFHPPHYFSNVATVSVLSK